MRKKKKTKGDGAPAGTGRVRKREGSQRTRGRRAVRSAPCFTLVSLTCLLPSLRILSFCKVSLNPVNTRVTVKRALLSRGVGVGLIWVRLVLLPPSQAVDYYLKALRSLGTRDIHPAVWDSVNWELSTTYFTMATLQQDYAPLSRKAQEQVTVCGVIKKPLALHAPWHTEHLLLVKQGLNAFKLICGYRLVFFFSFFLSP